MKRRQFLTAAAALTAGLANRLGAAGFEQDDGRTNSVTKNALARLRNFYIDSRFGQLHVHSAEPLAAASQTPLFCFHQGPQSGRVFEALLPRLGRDRRVYAPDYPGCGASSPAPEPFDLETLAAVMQHLIESTGHERVDLLGYHTGSCIAAELALSHPQKIRRIVMVGIPILDEDFDINRLYETGDGQPIPAPIAGDGSHLLIEWQRSAHWFEGAPVSVIQRAVIDKLLAGKHQTWSSRAALLYPLRDRLPLLEHPILAVGPRDDLWDYSPRAADLIRNGRFVRWPEHGFGLFDIAPDAVADLIREHLDD